MELMRIRGAIMSNFFYILVNLSPLAKREVNPQAPVAQKTADEVVFRRFQGEGVEFFLNRNSLTPHQIFDAHLLVNTD